MPAAGTRHVPMRRCVVCRSSLPKSNLIRFVRDDEGTWQLDPSGKAVGRGAWVCRKPACHERKALGRAFRSQAARVAEELSACSSNDGNREDASASQDGGIDV